MDDADRSVMLQEQHLDLVISAARGIKPQPGEHCRKCEEPLPEHRRQYGICWACQSRIEAAARRWGRQ